MGNDERAWWKITSKLEKDTLLTAVNSLAGLAIFFFGLCPRFSPSILHPSMGIP